MTATPSFTAKEIDRWNLYQAFDPSREIIPDDRTCASDIVQNDPEE